MEECVHHNGRVARKVSFLIGAAILYGLPIFMINGPDLRAHLPGWLSALEPDRIVQTLNKAVKSPEAVNLKTRQPVQSPAVRYAVETRDARKKQSLPRAVDEDSFQQIIVKAARLYTLDPALIKAIIKVESGFNPWAVSRKGAMGLMQLMPRTAESLGVKSGFDPENNILGGAKYFRQLLHRFKGNTHLALAAYHAGSKRVLTHQGVPPFKSTQNYLLKVLTYYRQYKSEMKNAISG